MVFYFTFLHIAQTLHRCSVKHCLNAVLLFFSNKLHKHRIVTRLANYFNADLLYLPTYCTNNASSFG